MPIEARPEIIPEPRVPRRLVPGPRVRVIELTLLAHIVVLFLSGVLAWQWKDRAHWLVLALLPTLAAFLLLVDLLRLRELAPIRNLALRGGIAVGEVSSISTTRWSRATRADSAFPRGWLPFERRLLVTFRFEDLEGVSRVGRFLSTRRDLRLYRPGSPIEVFFLPADPIVHAPSLVLRWYFKFAGSEKSLADETPPADFPGDEGVEVEWTEPDSVEDARPSERNQESN